jgi:hypothetical protein
MADLPKNETVRLTTGVRRLMHNPRIIEGETSSTGKTIKVETEHRGTYRLDTEKILSGQRVTRKGAYFELFTKKDFRSTQRGNLARGPVCGANEVTDGVDLPEQTHPIR